MPRQGNVYFAGAFSSGKTTEFDACTKFFPDEKIKEISRVLVEGGRYGDSIKNILDRGNFERFQTSICDISRQYEKIGEEQGGFLVDAGTVTSWAYVQDLPAIARQRLNNQLSAHFINHPPKKVLVFEPLPLVKDGIRHESSALQKVIHDRIVELCTNAGFVWELIPAMSKENRKKMIANALRKV